MRSSFKSCESVPSKLPSGFTNKSLGIFEDCTLSTTTRPWEVRANAAAYFSATRELGEKSVGKRMFRNGYMPLVFGLWTLVFDLAPTKAEVQRPNAEDHGPKIFFTSPFLVFHAKLRRHSFCPRGLTTK